MLEILQVADTVAREKGIDREIVISTIEEAIQKAGRSKYGFDQDIRVSSRRLHLSAQQASRALSCTSSWAWTGSTRRVALRRGPLRRPSSEAEARATRHWGKSIRRSLSDRGIEL